MFFLNDYSLNWTTLKFAFKIGLEIKECFLIYFILTRTDNFTGNIVLWSSSYNCDNEVP